MNPPSAPPLPEELMALLRRMRPYLRQAAPEVCATARAQRWDPVEVLRILFAEEVAGRDLASKRIRAAAAGFPSGKTFDSWRPQDSAIPRPTQQALMTLEWVDRAENLAVCGPSGTGKSHFCEALAHAVIAAGKRVAWFSLESLTATVSRAKVDASVQKVVACICRADLIVIDDIGILPGGQDAAEAFYRVVDAAYEKRSLAVTSNLHPARFRHHHAQGAGDRRRRPLAPPCPSHRHRRSLPTTCRGDGRQGCEAARPNASRDGRPLRSRGCKSTPFLKVFWVVRVSWRAW